MVRKEQVPGVGEAGEAPVAAIGGAVGVGPLLRGQVAAVDGRVAVLSEFRQCGDVEQGGGTGHRLDHALDHLRLVRVRSRVVPPAHRRRLAEAVLGGSAVPLHRTAHRRRMEVLLVYTNMSKR
ncbi:hypothetical protein BHE74_00014488 [Ensete ventricosum]|nr:hypothetical protein BHE74_00014488 [Ensete ventricosum]